MFDIQKAIKNSHLSKREILRLQAETKKEFPNDPMLYELHMIRVLRLGVQRFRERSKLGRFSLVSKAH